MVSVSVVVVVDCAVAVADVFAVCCRSRCLSFFAEFVVVVLEVVCENGVSISRCAKTGDA